jgi:hypothetical protein
MRGRTRRSAQSSSVIAGKHLIIRQPDRTLALLAEAARLAPWQAPNDLGSVKANDAKITAENLARTALVCVRQSTSDQLLNNPESRRRQYGLVDRGAGFRLDRGGSD